MPDVQFLSTAPAALGMQRRASDQWALIPQPVPAVVDILIPSCDRPAELAVTLAGLVAQDTPGFDVVVSDQSAEVPDWRHPAVVAMVRVLRAQGRTVTLTQHLPRRGMAEHRQHLLELALAPQILFLDNDVWLEPGALARMSSALQSLGCGFVGMAVQFWTRLPSSPSGEDVAAQWRVMERFGGAGLLPSGAVHLESPTTVPHRPVEAFDVIFPQTAG